MDEEDKKTVEKTLAHFNSLKMERQPWEATVENILKLVVPERSSMQVTTNVRTYEVDTESLDGTAKTSANLMANGLLGNVCSQKAPWFRMIPELPQHADIRGFRGWLDSVQNVFYHLMSSGGFYGAAWQVFFDAATPGLGSMMMLEDMNEQTINFQPYAPKGSFIATNARNQVDTFFHHFTQTARSIIEDYGKSKLSPMFLRNAEDNPYRRYELVNAIFPRKDRELFRIDSINKPFASLHILKGEKALLKNTGFDSFPLSVFRYAYDSEEVYPHSPSIDGAASIRRLNRVTKSTTNLAQLIAEPVQNIPSEIFNDFKLIPNFKNKVYDQNRLPSFMQMNAQGYPIGRDREEMYRQEVKEHYFTQFFMMLAAAEGTNMTATEVLERQGEKATVIGGMISRLTREFLDPVFDRLLIVAARNNWIPRPPDEVLDRKLNLKIDYLGPLAQAQQRYLKLQGPMASLQNFVPLLEAYPEMRDIIKPYELGKMMLVEGGMPNSILVEKEDYDAIIQQKQAAAQQAQDAETMKTEADAMAKGGKAPETGSPTEALLSAGGK